MEKRKFHVGDLLSITTDRLLSPQAGHPEGPYNLMAFMLGRPPKIMKLTEAVNKCRPCLIAQFPEFGAPEMTNALAELDRIRATKTKREESLVLQEWYHILVSGKLGVRFQMEYEVSPISTMV